jgi:hypothetical protein
MSKINQTEGKWSVTNTGGAVVSDKKNESNYHHTGTNGLDNRNAYGGWLICESVGCEDDANLIAGAREMFDTYIIIADRDKHEYAKDMVEKVSKRRWTSSELSEAAAIIRSKLGISY